MNLNKKVLEAKKTTEWSFGNSILYDLCRKYPNHTKKDEIIAKIWLIGRSYSAAIERRNKKYSLDNEDFYKERVAPKIKSSNIDTWFKHLKDHNSVNLENLTQLLEIHFKVMKLFNDISGKDKRSLASKYLHFHFPHLFFIYDSRATKGISKFRNITGKASKKNGKANYDNEYRKFCEKCLKIRNNIKKSYNTQLTPREIDNLLLY